MVMDIIIDHQIGYIKIDICFITLDHIIYQPIIMVEVIMDMDIDIILTTIEDIKIKKKYLIKLLILHIIHLNNNKI